MGLNQVKGSDETRQSLAASAENFEPAVWCRSTNGWSAGCSPSSDPQQEKASDHNSELDTRGLVVLITKSRQAFQYLWHRHTRYTTRLLSCCWHGECQS